MVDLIGKGNLDNELAVLDLLLVNSGEGLVLVVGVLELDEAEALGAAVTLGHNVSRGRVEALENLVQTLVVNGEGQVGNKEGGGRLSAGSSRGGLSAGSARGAGSVLTSSSGGTASSSAATATAATETTATTRGKVASSSTFTSGGTASSGSTTSSSSATTATKEATAASTSGGIGASSTTTATAGSGSGSILAVLSNLNVDFATVELLLVHQSHGLVSLSLSGELHKAIAQRARATSDNVGREANFA